MSGNDKPENRNGNEIADEGFCARVLIDHTIAGYRKYNPFAVIDKSKSRYDADLYTVVLVDEDGNSLYARAYTQLSVKAILAKQSVQPALTSPELLIKSRIVLSKRLGNWGRDE